MDVEPVERGHQRHGGTRRAWQNLYHVCRTGRAGHRGRW